MNVRTYVRASYRPYTPYTPYTPYRPILFISLVLGKISFLGITHH